MKKWASWAAVVGLGCGSTPSGDESSVVGDPMGVDSSSGGSAGASAASETDETDETDGTDPLCGEGAEDPACETSDGGAGGTLESPVEPALVACGNGVADPGETCGDNGVPCPIACADDGDPCTDDAVSGDPSTCDAECRYTPIEACTVPEAPRARGISIGSVSVDQGIRIPIREGDALVAPEARIGPLVVSRPMLVRAEWVIDEGFEARPVEAVLTLAHADGTTETLQDRKRPSTEVVSDYAELTTGFAFFLSADQVQDDLSLSIELFEVDESPASPGDENEPRFPAEPGSFFDFGDFPEATHLEVVLVPIAHDLGAQCEPAPDLSATILRRGVEIPEYEFYRQRLVAMNPVSDATVIVHEPVAFTGSAANSTGIQELLRDLREADGAGDWQFYYGLVQPCDGGPPFTGVSSPVLPDENGVPQREDARYRTGWGVYTGEGFHADVFVHEIGHQQGRNHVGCSELIDTAYPNTTGETEVYGWDVFSSGTIYSPDSFDYMSYCGSWWVSRYGWNLMEPWIAEVSAWRREAGN